MMDDDGNEMDLKQMEQEELKEETNIDMSRQNVVNDAETAGDLTIRDSLEDEIPEAAEVGFDMDDSEE
jgi:DNA-directed RNA polymerase subunit beta